jgi:FtsP/CotA-like multicopper oxidase with cupredoxin domain
LDATALVVIGDHGYLSPAVREDAMPSTPQTSARPGDHIVAQGFRGAHGRRGEVLEVLGAPGHEHYRVRWDDAHESILYPTDGVVVERREDAPGAE